MLTETRTLPLQPDVRNFFEGVKPLIGPRPYGYLDFEVQSPIGEANRREFVDLMVSLPGDEGRRQFCLSRNLAQISQDAASHRALETMYLGPKDEIEGEEEGLMWARLSIENIHNAMAVRNRLRIVKDEFREHVRGLLQEGRQSIQVLSIAAGSSRAVLETIASFDGSGENRLRLQLVDLNREALRDGRKLAEELGVDGSIQFTRTTYASFRRYLHEGYRPDFVEIVGLLDYLSSTEVVRLLRGLQGSLSDEGVILYSNIAPNDEQQFTHRVVGWPDMYYRTQTELSGFARDGGFDLRQARVVQEPLGIYNLMILRR